MIKVLIVEDDPMVSYLNKKYVERVGGYKIVETADNGETALKILKTLEIDLVIMDIYMPKLNGIDLLKEMRKRFILTDVIIVTAAKETESIDSVLKLGAVDYLIKPFEYERLKRTLDNYKERYLLLHNHDMMNQDDIDIIMKRGNENDQINKLDKGLHKNTLNRIRSFMNSKKGVLLSAEEIAQQMDFSRVTTRRYLDYLISIGEITLEIEYGSIGRPTYLYRYHS